MGTENNPVGSTTIYDENSPEAVRYRKRFWTIWVIVNLALIFVIVPGAYMLISDAAVQIADGGTHTRTQAAIGMYLLGTMGTFCSLLIPNAVALTFGLLAKAARQRRRNQPAGSNPHSGRQI